MKIKFPIILKIALLGILVVGIATGVALAISTISRRQENEKTLIDNVDKTLASIDYNYTESDNSLDLCADLSEIKEYIAKTYNNPETGLYDKTLEDFASFEEYEEYFKSQVTWVFVPQGVIGSSEASLKFKRQYRELSLILQEARLSSGARGAYVSYSEQTESGTRLVFICDSRIANPNQDDKFYHLPCSHYLINPETDTMPADTGEKFYGAKLNGYLERAVGIYNAESIDHELIATVFLEYDLNAIWEQTLAVLFKELWVIAGIMAATVAVYMLLAHLTITRNLNKLTKATDGISENLKNKKPIVPHKLAIKSHDEIASLSSSFEIMEGEIINYIDIIKQEAKESERREAELDVASKIQLSALPQNNYKDETLGIDTYIKPAKVVGGDFYDYFYNKDGFVVIIADVSGKGIPASLFMMKAKTLIKSKLSSGESLSSVVKQVNEELNLNNTESLFVTAFIGIYDYKNGELRYVAAGHEKPYIIRKNEVVKLDGESNYVLGIIDGVDFIEEKIAFSRGDMLFAFTDGLNESINDKKEEFGYERIERVLSESDNLTPDGLIDAFNRNLGDFIKDEEQFDDITMLVLKSGRDLHLHYEKKDYGIIEDATDKFYRAFPELDEERKAHIGIALDELINNLISYEKREDLSIEIDFSLSQGEITIVLSSNGDDYNPFAANDKERVLKSADEEKIGGYGVFLVTEFTKEQKYEYKDNRSVVTLIL